MKYPYTTLDVTTPDCGPRTRRIGTKLGSENGSVHNIFNNTEKETP